MPSAFQQLKRRANSHQSINLAQGRIGKEISLISLGNPERSSHRSAVEWDFSTGSVNYY